MTDEERNNRNDDRTDATTDFIDWLNINKRNNPSAKKT